MNTLYKAAALMGLISGCAFGMYYVSTNKETVEVIEVKAAQKQVEKPFENEKQILYNGPASYYSHDGCLGCSENQIMGNGQPFDEMDMTLAVPCEDVVSGTIKYNTQVVVTNAGTGQSQVATVTDCGGFSKYGRVADLSLGLKQVLDVETDEIVIIQKI